MQKMLPQPRQWCLRWKSENAVSHLWHLVAWSSGTHVGFSSFSVGGEGEHNLE